MNLNDENAQISGEYLLLIGSLIIILMISIAFISQEEELIIAMAAADNGINEATSLGAIYPKESYGEYEKSKIALLTPYSVEIINISYENQGYDNAYQREKIQFKVYANSKNLDKKDLDSIGDRINYDLRKSIAISFNTSNAGNKLYNPAFSPHYVYTTANVKWV